MRVIFILILVLVTNTFVLAIPTITFQHDEIRIGETALAQIEVNKEFIREIEPEHIKFYEGRKEIFMESDIIFYENIHYLAIYTTRTGNFTLKISEILYKENGELKSHTIEMPLKISNAEVSIEDQNETIRQALSIRPGNFLSASQPHIKLINKGDSNLTYQPFIVNRYKKEFEKL